MSPPTRSTSPSASTARRRPANALRVAAQLAGALDFAAAVQIGHGALHPRDVLLSSDETRLTGLGVARALERIGVVAPVRRPYTAPERIAGGEWDRRADVFSLAALIARADVGPAGQRPRRAGGREPDRRSPGGDLPRCARCSRARWPSIPRTASRPRSNSPKRCTNACPGDRGRGAEPATAHAKRRARGDRREPPRLPLDREPDGRDRRGASAPAPARSEPESTARRRRARRAPPNAPFTVPTSASRPTTSTPASRLHEPDDRAESAAETLARPSHGSAIATRPRIDHRPRSRRAVRAGSNTRRGLAAGARAGRRRRRSASRGGFFAGSREQPGRRAATAREWRRTAAPVASERRKSSRRR